MYHFSFCCCMHMPPVIHVPLLFLLLYPHAQWSTITFEGTILKLYELFEDVFAKMKGSSQASAESQAQASSASAGSSPALPVISAIRLRLLLLKPDEKLHRLELGGTLDSDDVKLMYSEAMRRLSLQNWPHKDYV